MRARKTKNRGVDLKKMKWFSDPAALARDAGIDVFVELIGGDGNPALGAIEAALKSGKSVVTANKALLAKHGVKLATLAEQHHVALNFEAAVGGAIPIVKTLREGLAGNSFERIYGILNGTCNYILTRMEQDRMPFADALKQAQQLGYAEADPSFDIEGHDTAQKLVDPGLARLRHQGRSERDLCGRHFLDHAGRSHRRRRTRLSREASGRRGEDGQKASNSACIPTMVRKDSAIAQVMGVTNAVTIDAEGINPLTLVGPGAGGAATASAVLSDIGDIARGVRTAPFGRPIGAAESRAQGADAASRGRLLHQARWRATSREPRRPSPRGWPSRRFRWNRSCSGTPNTPPSAVKGGSVPVILITYATSEDAVRKALAAVGRDRVISGSPQVIRIEKN